MANNVCKQSDFGQNKVRKHGLCSRKTGNHPLFKTWLEMRYRCEKPTKHNYKYYGGKGISVCERWQNFGNFVTDMGDKPPGFTLDRIDVNGNYSPSNCRWASKETQMNNISTNRKVSVNGINMTMSQASKKWGVSVGVIWWRLKAGWDDERACLTPTRKHKAYEWQSANNRILDKLQ